MKNIIIITFLFFNFYSSASDLPCSKDQITHAFDSGYYQGFDHAIKQTKEEEQKIKKLEKDHDKIELLKRIFDEDLKVLVEEIVAPFREMSEDDSRTYIYTKLKNKGMAESTNDYSVKVLSEVIRDETVIARMIDLINDDTNNYLIIAFILVIYFLKKYMLKLKNSDGEEKSLKTRFLLITLFNMLYVIVFYVTIGTYFVPLIRVMIRVL